MHQYRTDLALERTIQPDGSLQGVFTSSRRCGPMETTWVKIESAHAAQLLGKAQGAYWTLSHPQLPQLSPKERMPIAAEIAQVLRIMLPPEGTVLVLGLGNRRLTADALGDRVISGMLVTRHIEAGDLRSVSALAPGVMGVTGVETAEFAKGMTERIRPSALIVVDALAAMQTSRIATTVQITDAGIQPGSGVGNHRAAINAQTMQLPVIAIGVPMVVYASTIVRDALAGILQQEEDAEKAQHMAQALLAGYEEDMVVTPRNIDELVQGIADMLALAINAALQPSCTLEDLAYFLH